MKQSKLFMTLPEYVCTPDGMAIDKEGNLILACPNFADPSMPGCICRIDANRNISKWFDVPVLEETGCARPMGIAFGPDGDLYICDNQGWSGDEKLQFKGRILRVRMNGSDIVKTTTVAYGMEHPNGIRIRGNYMYVTQSLMTKVKHESGKMVSCVYRFALDDENIEITNTLEDKNILTTFITHNPQCQYGADGIEFDEEGNLYVGNFGDGAVHKISFDENGNVKENIVWAKDPSQLKSTDGIVRDRDGNLYVADFSDNAIVKIYPDGRVERIAESPDSDGLNGELDQPGEPIVWNGMLVVSCFDLVTGPDKVNTRYELPATLAYLEL